jgi:hypothetical protein
MTPAGDPIEYPHRTTGRSNLRRYTMAFRCDNEDCHALSVGVGTVFEPSSLTDAKNRLPQTELAWTPNHVSRPEFPDVPEQIAEAASEAHACLSIQAYRGAVALARAVVEATAKDQGVTSGPLVKKIDQMQEKNLIRDITRQLAHEIREGGNEIAHGDLGDEPMPPEDAEAIVSLMDEILQEVYQGPARMLRLRKSREEREQRNAAKKAGAEIAS